MWFYTGLHSLDIWALGLIHITQCVNVIPWKYRIFPKSDKPMIAHCSTTSCSTKHHLGTFLTFPVWHSLWRPPSYSDGVGSWWDAAGAHPLDTRFPCKDSSPGAADLRSDPSVSPAAPAGSGWSCSAPGDTRQRCWGSLPCSPPLPWRRYPPAWRRSTPQLLSTIRH